MAKNNSAQAKPRILPIFFLGISIIGIGTIFYHIVEGLTLIDSFYFSAITLTTIGYGDITPQKDVGKLFTVFYVLIGITLLAGIANYILKSALIERIQKKQQEQENRKN